MHKSEDVQQKAGFFSTYIKALFNNISDLGRNILQIAIIIGRKVGAGVSSAVKWLGRVTTLPRKSIVSFFVLAFGFFASPFVKIRRDYRRMRADIINSRGKKGFLAEIKYIFKFLAKIFFGKRGIAISLFNYAMPIISIISLFSIVSYATSLDYAVKISIDGQVYGYISDERIFDEADVILQQKITYLDGAEPISFSPEFVVEMTTSDKIMTKYQLADKMLKNLDADVENAYGLFISGKFYGAVIDKEEIDNTLDALLNKYRTGNKTETVSFVNDIKFEQGLYLTQSIVDEQNIIDKISGVKQVAAYYTVAEGDSQWLVAEKLGISLDELYRLNPSIEGTYLTKGQQLVTSREEPFLAVSVTRQEVYETSVAYKTKNVDDSSRFKGAKYIEQEGEKGINKVTANVSYVNGYESKREIIKTEVVKEPVDEIIKVGTKPVPSGNYSSETAVAGKFIWPVGGTGGYISEEMYGYGGYYGHKGLDIAGVPTGTPIFAADSGVVIASGKGWNSGYGNYVLIRHDNGLVTRYAHAYTLNVYTGQRVTQGQQIATVGSTGRVTGVHLHFEVISGDTYINPRNYLPRR